MSAAPQYRSYAADRPNPYLLRKLDFPERPMKVTFEYWDGTTRVESEDTKRRAIVQRMLDKLSYQEISDLSALVEGTRKAQQVNAAEEEIFRRPNDLGNSSHTPPANPLELITSPAVDQKPGDQAEESGRDTALLEIPGQGAR